MFGERLRLLRKQRGLTQEQLALILGLERSSIGKYEGKSKTIPSDDVKQKIAEYFNVSMDYLFGREKNSCDPSVMNSVALSPDETELIELFRDLNEKGREWLMRSARMVHDDAECRKQDTSNMAI